MQSAKSDQASGIYGLAAKTIARTRDGVVMAAVVVVGIAGASLPARAQPGFWGPGIPGGPGMPPPPTFPGNVPQNPPTFPGNVPQNPPTFPGNVLQNPVAPRASGTAARMTTPVPRITSRAEVGRCERSTGSDTDLQRCILYSMASPREQAVFDCTRNGPNPTARAACVVNVIGGPNERRIARDVESCRGTGRADWNDFSYCMAERNTGGEAQRVVGCMREQSRQGNMSTLSVIGCYGGRLLGLNSEAQVALNCAISSGGEPLATAGCTAGELTRREMEKCQRRTAGQEDGCFGPNNTIVQIANQLGLNLGPGNDAYRAWNSHAMDALTGPGRNNDAVRAVNMINQELARSTATVADALARVRVDLNIDIRVDTPRMGTAETSIPGLRLPTVETPRTGSAATSVPGLSLPTVEPPRIPGVRLW